MTAATSPTTNPLLPRPWPAILAAGLLAGVLLLTTGCARLAIRQFAGPLHQTLEETTDLELLAQGMPALLLAQEGLLRRYPNDPLLLRDAVKGWAAYSQLLACLGDEDGARRSAGHAAVLADRLLALAVGQPDAATLPAARLRPLIQKVDGGHIADLFWAGFGRGVWVQRHGGEPTAVAWLARIVPMMERVVTVDEGYAFAGAHLFLGAYYASLPPMAGGRPQEARAHFQRALELTGRRYLMAQVLYADTYARRVQDGRLFRALLHEVLAAPTAAPGAGAANAMAQRLAARLLPEADTLEP